MTPETIKPLGKQRYWVLAFCFLTFIIAYLDRSNVAVLIADPAFTNALGIANDKSTQGSFMSIFLACYGMCHFLSGPIVQRFGPARALVWGLALWAVVTALMGMVNIVTFFLVCRALLGIGESVIMPSVAALIQTWFPARERATANGVWYSGMKIAQIIATPVLAWWIYQVGWRGSFFILAAVGLIPLILVRYVHDRPSMSPKITKEEVDYIVDGGGVETSVTSKIDFSFLKSFNFWNLTAIWCFVNASIWGFVSWVPSYLKATLGFTWAQMGALASLPYIAATVAVLLISPLMDKYNRRAIFILVCLIIYAGSLAAAMTAESRMAAVAILTLALGFGSVATPTCFTILQNLIDKKQIASATGIMNGISYTFASITPYGMGFLYDVTGTLKSGFFGLSAMVAIAIILSIPFVRQRL